MSEPDKAFLVTLELKRIQTYLFDVPNLRVMLGANSLMGETLRGKWLGKEFSEEPRSLPWLAQRHNSSLPKGVTLDCLIVREDDPYRATADDEGNVYQDGVTDVAQKTGVLIRDAGRFEAVFPAATDAREPADTDARGFVQSALSLVQERLPGILLQVHVKRLIKSAAGWSAEDWPENPNESQESLGVSVFDLPQAEMCAISGHEPASETIKEGGDDDRAKPVGPSVHSKWLHAQEFDKNNACDVMGVLRSQLISSLKLNGQGRAFPSRLEEVAVDGYLAVIHADGNGVGSRFQKYRCNEGCFFQQWQHNEKFFYQLRSGFRVAVSNAINATFGAACAGKERAPLRVLMLGGDDLLLVCGATYALHFVKELADQVKLSTKLPDTEGPLTLGVGVAIVQEKYPFHMAHSMAEQLAASAKRLRAAIGSNGDVSVVDWAVVTESWHEEIESTRRKQYRTRVDGKDLILSGKPYRILAERGKPSLDDLLTSARSLCFAGGQAAATQEPRIARTQFKSLAEKLVQGYYSGRLAVDALPDPARQSLSKYLDPHFGPWRPCYGPETAARGDDLQQQPSGFLTQLLDLLELCELERMSQGPGSGLSLGEPEKEVAS